MFKRVLKRIHRAFDWPKEVTLLVTGFGFGAVYMFVLLWPVKALCN